MTRRKHSIALKPALGKTRGFKQLSLAVSQLEAGNPNSRGELDALCEREANRRDSVLQVG